MADARVSFTLEMGILSHLFAAGRGHIGLLPPHAAHLADSTPHTCLCGEQRPAELLASTCLEQLIIPVNSIRVPRDPSCSQWLSLGPSVPLMAVLINKHASEPHFPDTEFSASQGVSGYSLPVFGWGRRGLV